MTPAATSTGAWVAARLPADVAHLDCAAAGRVSAAVLEAEVAHLRAEAGGAYRAEADAEPLLEAGRRALAALVGQGPDRVAHAPDGAAAFRALLESWPLRRGARVGTVTSEYGGNALVLQQLAGERGWELVDVPVDALGRVRDVPDRLDLLTLPLVASQRGVVQPVEAGGPPVLLDVAQALGQTDVPRGCAAYVGTSRKWLCGPRGVGFAVLGDVDDAALTPPPVLTAAAGVRRWEAPEAHVAGRVGLAVAVQEWTPALLPVVHGLARTARTLLDGVGGWQVVEPADEPTGITTLRPPPGADPLAVRAALLADGLLTSAVPTTRAADVDVPLLRVSTAAWVTRDDLERLAQRLADGPPGARVTCLP